ncbi:YhcB family protein [Aeromonas diversa]|uniref:Z-ring associated protein G n=1 Tax=Aeromonas diversa CDC 2478-85 TaxID=1268237 RepID=N9U3H4_9GAMM|nr:YhcB family protein [Aeromonas diversa]ENY72885.1 hypothetical protein G114_05645 [Aeromonas diversa CDC 2478-85]
MSLISAIGVAIIALVLGIVLGRLSVRSRDAGRLEQDLKKAHKELDSYQNQISTHFADSAALMEQMAEQYQELYRHMAQQSQFLAKHGDSPFKVVEDAPQPQNAEPDFPPRDYADASGLLKQSGQS